MKRKAIIDTNIPGLATSIRLRVLIETGENTNKFKYNGFTKFYPFTETEKAKQFATKYCEIVEINN